MHIASFLFCILAFSAIGYLVISLIAQFFHQKTNEKPNETKTPVDGGPAFSKIEGHVSNVDARIFNQKTDEKCGNCRVSSANDQPKENKIPGGAESAFPDIEELVRDGVAQRIRSSRTPRVYLASNPKAAIGFSTVSLGAAKLTLKELFGYCRHWKSVDMPSGKERSQIAYVRLKHTGEQTAVLLWMATVKVSNVSLGATKRDIKELFDYCGGIRFVEMQSDNERSQIAYVTFKHVRGAETAVLLSGAIIGDMPVTITPDPYYVLPPSRKAIKQITAGVRKQVTEDYQKRMSKKPTG